MNYKLNHHEYVSILRRLADVIKWNENASVKEMILEILRVKYDYKNCYFEVPEELMQRIAIVNMCDMSLIQLKDSKGEIDYADLGDHSKRILNSILQNINDI